MQKRSDIFVCALASLAALAACDGARFELQTPVRTVWDRQSHAIITIATPRGPDGAIAWRDRVRIVATQLQPWRQHGIDVPDPNLANMAVMIAEAGRLTKELCPLSRWTVSPRADTAKVFSMSDVGAVDVLRERVVFEREVVVADVLPRSSHYALHLLNCENIGNYTHGPNGTAPYALSLNMEVSIDQISRLAFVARSFKAIVRGSWGKRWAPLDSV